MHPLERNRGNTWAEMGGREHIISLTVTLPIYNIWDNPKSEHFELRDTSSLLLCHKLVGIFLIEKENDKERAMLWSPEHHSQRNMEFLCLTKPTKSGKEALCAFYFQSLQRTGKSFYPNKYIGAVQFAPWNKFWHCGDTFCRLSRQQTVSRQVKNFRDRWKTYFNVCFLCSMFLRRKLG